MTQLLFLGVFAEYFSNPLTWVFCGVFVLIGVLLGILLRPWVGNEVVKFMPDDHRFVKLPIDEETAISISCKKKKGMPLQRFFKYHPGFTGIVGRVLKKPITMFIGREGTAYTWKLEDGWKKLGSLADALRTVLGEDLYSELSEPIRTKMEKSKIQVTVGLDKSPLTPEGLKPISEENLKQEEDRRASQTFWREHGAQMKGWFINMILAGGTGFGIALALQIMGILDVSPAQQPVQQAAESAAEMIRHLIQVIFH